VRVTDAAPKETVVRTIRVFEPALCCNTGVCGPDVDEALVAFTADLKHLQGLGVDIERHNLANDPQAFAGNDAVRTFLQVAGSAGLPLTLVDGITVATGSYPHREDLLRYAGLGVEQQEPGSTPEPVVPQGVTSLTLAAAESQPCCGGSGCC
jgi:hypothetical protein